MFVVPNFFPGSKNGFGKIMMNMFMIYFVFCIWHSFIEMTLCWYLIGIVVKFKERFFMRSRLVALLLGSLSGKVWLVQVWWRRRNLLCRGTSRIAWRRRGRSSVSFLDKLGEDVFHALVVGNRLRKALRCAMEHHHLRFPVIHNPMNTEGNMGTIPHREGVTNPKFLHVDYGKMG